MNTISGLRFACFAPILCRSLLHVAEKSLSSSNKIRATNPSLQCNYDLAQLQSSSNVTRFNERVKALSSTTEPLWRLANHNDGHDFSSLVKNMFRGIQPTPKTGDSVLEIGCGTGAVIEAMRTTFSSVQFSKMIGLDPAEDALQVAAKRVPHANFKVGDGRNIHASVGSDRFDIVISTITYLLHDAKEVECMLQGMLQATKPGGVVVITTIPAPDVNGGGISHNDVARDWWTKAAPKYGGVVTKVQSMKSWGAGSLYDVGKYYAVYFTKSDVSHGIGNCGRRCWCTTWLLCYVAYGAARLLL